MIAKKLCSISVGLSILILTSCSGDSKTSQETRSDTTIFMNRTIGNVQITIDTMLLGFTPQMTKADYHKRLKLLLEEKKLKKVANIYVYPIRVRNIPLLEDLMNEKYRDTFFVETGELLPEFYHDSLVELRLLFRRPLHGDVFTYLTEQLNEKYYKIYDLQSLKNSDTLTKKYLRHLVWDLKNLKLTLKEVKYFDGRPPSVELTYRCKSCFAKIGAKQAEVNNNADEKIQSDL